MTDDEYTSRFWRVTRKPENQTQFPGTYATRHVLHAEATKEDAFDWAVGYFAPDEIVKVEPYKPGEP